MIWTPANEVVSSRVMDRNGGRRRRVPGSGRSRGKRGRPTQRGGITPALIDRAVSRARLSTPRIVHIRLRGREYRLIVPPWGGASPRSQGDLAS